jgi:hypothetical protein
MFISHRHKIIFIHIQKAGGSSIQRLFEALDPQLVTHIGIDPAKNRPKHCFATDIAEVTGHEMFTDYTTFSVVRNPFDRLVSWYWMLKLRSFEEANPDIIETEGDKVNFALIDELNKQAATFEEFVHLPENHSSGLFKRFFFNQLDFISDSNGIIVDHVLRFENLQDDFAGFASAQGISGQLTHMNKTPREADYRRYYNDTTRQLISERFRRDLNYFDYRF